MNKEIDLIDKYCSVWNEVDRTKRKNQLQEIWEENGKYIDPRAHLTNIEALVNHIGKIQSSRKGTKIIRTSNLDVHHGIGKFHWQLVKEDQTILIKGLDIVYFDQREVKSKRG